MSDDIVDRLRLYAQRQRETKSSVLGLLLSDAADKIERLRTERDEARREILESMHPDLRESYAAAREWDCYKENTDD